MLLQTLRWVKLISNWSVLVVGIHVYIEILKCASSLGPLSLFVNFIKL